MGTGPRLDRETVTRILRRAEAMAGTDPGDDGEPGVEEAALIAAVEELGAPVEAVRRSLAMERLGPVPPAHVGDHVLGPGLLIVDDEVAGAPRELLARFDAWMVDGHHLRRDRLRDDAGCWSKRSDVVGRTIRAIRSATGEGHLGEVARVGVDLRDSGTGTCAVRVTVDRRADRRRAGFAGSAIAVGGTAAGAVVFSIVASPLLVLAAPVAVGTGVVVARHGRRKAARTTYEVERLIESVRLERDPTRLRRDVARRVAGRSATAIPTGASSRRSAPPVDR
jgi:hypothetical protein